MSETIVEVRGLVTQFGTHRIHDRLDLDVRRGEILGVVGGSGTGKSVLLRTITGLLTPTAGQVRLFGIDVHAATGADRAELGRRTGVMFQDGALFSALTVAENVMVPLADAAGLDRATRRGLAEMKLGLAGLPPNAADKYPAELSGGMRKRAGLARALAMDPEIVFLDEPTAGLDPIGAAAFDGLVRQLSDALGLTVFLVTHDLDTLYATCDRIAVLAEKRVLVTGTLAEMERVDHPWIAEYFRGPRARAAQAGAATGGAAAARGAATAAGAAGSSGEGPDPIAPTDRAAEGRGHRRTEPQGGDASAGGDTPPGGAVAPGGGPQ